MRSRSITADTALRLAAYFSNSAELWLNLQSEYDLRQARLTLGPEIQRTVRNERVELPYSYSYSYSHSWGTPNKKAGYRSHPFASTYQGKIFVSNILRNEPPLPGPGFGHPPTSPLVVRSTPLITAL
ncbi:MAG: HigA family addiction module antidote protein [Bryobacterales bacterium]|nr:HigA family addiction module antidote protein [Bryobacterales bacterium]